ncbi:ribosome biogenesis protein [Niveomyces insectorum RCEF 264]|uniref:Ribosome biogenesis protein n=1 Tax=Niveomyces insectorum RCEF 264 TaxID=1081102 RepID=A0A167XMC5_9HYPO|nr:ribosome biogenesis protein [Niveomyces insectorum RCEF 264]
MVVRMGAGEVGPSVSQLASDVRRVMEPGTASRLKERRANRLRDYVTMCGPLGVTQLLMFSRSESGNVNLRVAAAPRGPTLHFRVERYSLSKDVQRAQRHPKGGGKEYITPPLLVMNNFNVAADANAKVPKHLESLVTTIFQSLFPPINPQAAPLTSIRRVLLLNREQSGDDDANSFVVNFRHYAITTKPAGISKALKRLNAAEKLAHSRKTKKGGLPNLGRLQDIADYMVGGENGDGYITDGGTSGSEAETDAEVEVTEPTTRKVLSSKARQALASSADQDDAAEGQADSTGANVERRAVKLVELGPRMKLRLIKIEEGMCQGQVMWHEHIHKSQKEIKEMKRRWEERKREKEERRKQQKENVERKKKERSESGQGRKKSGGGDGDEHGEGEDDDDAMDVDEFDSDDYGDFDSEGLAGDAELQVNRQMEEAGDWEDEEEEIAGK